MNEQAPPATLAAARAGGPAVSALAVAAAILIALTAVRLIGLSVSVVDLYVDESQYWSWSREFAFGYFSKPPLIAWIIAATEPLCGSGEACVRAASPILYLGTSLLAYAIARELYDERTALWTALTLALSTGVAFSARIISTDVPLLFCWALALLAYVKLLRGPSLRWTLLLGIGLGLGLLAKYAMSYFLGGVLLAAIVDRNARALMLRPQTWIAVAVAAVILAPNIVWNLNNGLATFAHTADNIDGGGLRWMPLKAAEFVAAQFAVIGPFLFAGLLVLFVRWRRPDLRPQDRTMLAFAAVPLVAVTAFAFVRNAHPNWAATAFVSAAIVVVALWVRNGQWRWIAASLLVGVAVQAVLLVGDTMAYRISVPALGRNADLYHRTLGWRALGESAERLASEAGTPSIAATDRSVAAALVYYLRDSPHIVHSWPRAEKPAHHFDQTFPLTDAAAEPILFIGPCGPASFQPYFADVRPLGAIIARTGPTSERAYFAFRLSGRLRPLGPLQQC